MSAEGLQRVWVQISNWGGGGGVRVAPGMMDRGVPWPWSPLSTVGLCGSARNREGNTFLSVYCWFCFSFIYESEM